MYFEEQNAVYVGKAIGDTSRGSLSRLRSLQGRGLVDKRGRNDSLGISLSISFFYCSKYLLSVCPLDLKVSGCIFDLSKRIS